MRDEVASYTAQQRHQILTEVQTAAQNAFKDRKDLVFVLEKSESRLKQQAEQVLKLKASEEEQRRKLRKT